MRRALVLASAAVLLVASGCGSAGPSGGAATKAQPPASGAEMTAVADRVFPFIQQFGIYVECTDIATNGAPAQSEVNGQKVITHDYSRCPLTERLKARLLKTQATFVESQNPSTNRTIRTKGAPGGGVAEVRLYDGHVGVDLVLAREKGQLLVDDVLHKGSFDLEGPIVFEAKPPAEGVTPPTPSEPRPSATAGRETRLLEVPWYHQSFELSCEEASLRMALAKEGIQVTDQEILDFVGTDRTAAVFGSDGLHWGDPYVTFVGNPGGSEVAFTGYGTYFPPIANAARARGGRVLQAGEGTSAQAVYSAILSGHPVVAWVTFKWVTPARTDYRAFDGRLVPYAGPVEHAVAVVGVRPDAVYVNDPWFGPSWISKPIFERAYAIYNNMAVVLD